MFNVFALVTLSILCLPPALATTREVSVDEGVDTPGSLFHGCGGCGAKCKSIGCALDLSNNGDVILVHPGVYNGPQNRQLTIGDKRLEIRSVSDNWADTIIDCEWGGRGFWAEGDQDQTNLKIRGFTMQHCVADTGAAVYTETSAASLQNMFFYQNRADSFAVALDILFCPTGVDLVLSDLWFDSNEARFNDTQTSWGGALYVGTANPCGLQMRNVSMTRHNLDPNTNAGAFVVSTFFMTTVRWDGGLIADNLVNAFFGASFAVDFQSNQVYLSGIEARNNTTPSGVISISLARFGLAEIVCSDFRNNTATLAQLSGPAGKITGRDIRGVFLNSSVVDNVGAVVPPGLRATSSGFYLAFLTTTSRFFLVNSVFNDNLANDGAVQDDVYCQATPAFLSTQKKILVIADNSVVGRINSTQCAVDPNNSTCIPDAYIVSTTVTCPNFQSGSPYLTDSHPVCGVSIDPVPTLSSTAVASPPTGEASTGSTSTGGSFSSTGFDGPQINGAADARTRTALWLSLSVAVCMALWLLVLL